MLQALFYGLIGGLLSLVGGFAVLLGSKAILRYITLLVAFAAGTFLGVSFLDILPEAVEMVSEPHQIFISVLVGFVAFFVLERSLMRYSHDHSNPSEHGDHTEALPLLVVLGDSFHNFLDGVAIAFAYVANPALGLTTTLAIAAHEVPQEIGDFAVLLDRGWSKTKIMVVNIFSSLLTLLGVALGYLATSFFGDFLPYLLGGVAGIFIYIAASDLIPEIHHRSGHKNLYGVLGAFLLGLALIWYLTSLTHAE